MRANHPRRLAPPAPFGALLKRVIVPPPRPYRNEAERDPDYLAMVRQCPCLCCGMEPSEAAHVRFASAAFGKASGLGKKPDDRFSAPLCAGCHRLGRDAQHNRGEQAFWHALGINPLIVCERLYAQRGDLVAMRAVIFTTIANRKASHERS
jgi:hypothetical protein